MSLGSPMRNKQFLFFWSYQKRKCYLCGGRMGHPNEGFHGHSATTDHVLPISRHGQRRFNILLAHRGCNCRKNSRSPTACELFFAHEAWVAYEGGGRPRQLSGKAWGTVDKSNLMRLGMLFSKAERVRQRVLGQKKDETHGCSKISVLDRSSGEHELVV